MAPGKAGSSAVFTCHLMTIVVLAIWAEPAKESRGLSGTIQVFQYGTLRVLKDAGEYQNRQ